MTLRKLDRTGHTETELSPDEMVTELEKQMNRGYVAIVGAPGREDGYLRAPADIKGWPAETTVTVMPQLRGG